MTENYIAKILSNEFASYFTDSLEEIRIRKNKPVIFSYPDNEIQSLYPVSNAPKAH